MQAKRFLKLAPQLKGITSINHVVQTHAHILTLRLQNFSIDSILLMENLSVPQN